MQEYDQSKTIDLGFINLDSILTAQRQALTGASITKFVEQDLNSEQQELTLDEVQWVQELKVFGDIDLNKPGLVGSYIKTTKDHGLLELFDRKPSEKRGPKHVEIKRTPDGSLLEVNAHIFKSNILYETKKDYALRFEPSTGLLKSYEFAGTQKLIMKDKVDFRISGEIK